MVLQPKTFVVFFSTKSGQIWFRNLATWKSTLHIDDKIVRYENNHGFLQNRSEMNSNAAEDCLCTQVYSCKCICVSSKRLIFRKWPRLMMSLRKVAFVWFMFGVNEQHSAAYKRQSAACEYTTYRRHFGSIANSEPHHMNHREQCCNRKKTRSQCLQRVWSIFPCSTLHDWRQCCFELSRAEIRICRS